MLGKATPPGPAALPGMLQNTPGPEHTEQGGDLGADENTSPNTGEELRSILTADCETAGTRFAAVLKTSAGEVGAVALICLCRQRRRQPWPRQEGARARGLAATAATQDLQRSRLSPFEVSGAVGVRG